MSKYIEEQKLFLKLKWENLTLTHKETNKIILNNLNGSLKSGDFLTIMGSSGAGKSSFLSLITKTESCFKKFQKLGKITLNNKQYTKDELFSITSYVAQQDLFLENLTVKQVFQFQAQLKLYGKSQCIKQQRINHILKLLNLYDARNSYIGGYAKKSISGGQKKRVAIGVQLLSDPKLLILDQPTSGLDSFNSLKIIQILLKLAKQEKKLIIATIHQPSSLIFQNFDKLMVLHKGKTVYFEDCIRLVPYMQSINIKVDQRMNPADFLMLQISAYKQQNQNYITKMTSQNFVDYKKQKMVIQQNQQCKQINFQVQKAIPFQEQFKPLIQRSLKNFIRSPFNQGGRVMQMIIFPLFVGITFYDILDRVPLLSSSSQQQLVIFLNQLVSLFYLSLFFTICQSVYDTLLVFPGQKQLILKQVHSKMYYMSVYYLSKLVIELPIMFVSVIISSSIIYAIIGLESSPLHWFYYLSTFLLVALGGYMIGISTGAMCKDQLMAIQAAVLIMMPIMAFGGQSVNLRTVPWYSKWCSYITPLRYGYNILLRDQLSDSKYNNIGNNEEIMQLLGLEYSSRENLIQLILVCFAFTTLSFVVLYGRRKLG